MTIKEKYKKLKKMIGSYEPKRVCGLTIIDKNGDELEQLNDYGSFCPDCIEKVVKTEQDRRYGILRDVLAKLEQIYSYEVSKVVVNELRKKYNEKVDWSIYDSREDDSPQYCQKCGDLLDSAWLIQPQEFVEGCDITRIDDNQTAYIMYTMIEDGYYDCNKSILKNIEVD